MDGNTFIGFNWVEWWAYCEKCDYYFKYGYNSAGTSFDTGDTRCPKCKSNENVETEDGISFTEDFLMHVLHHPVKDLSDTQIDELNKELSKLGKIRNKFKELRNER